MVVRHLPEGSITKITVSNRRETMKSTSKTALIATLAITGAFAAGFATGPASAQTIYRGPFEFEFKYDAAELGSVESAQNLLARLHSVVTAYCGDAPTLSPEERF